ncbi:hypothetical protein [Massilia consociata]|uniref:Glycosyltransferase RgtA/B/C/D-like domain-containing protein n=1 Tax=Massilia consociata TaxID=760117 RepID=A0ABV6FJT0_9BURK
MLITAAALLTKTRLAFVVLFVVLALVLPLNDPDYFWHLKAGEYIVNHRGLPAGDIFSFTHAGQPWVLHEWLFEVMLFGAFALWGSSGVKLLTALFAVVTLGVTFSLMRRLGQSSLVASLLAICGGVVLAGGWTPRPQLVTYLFFALYLSILLAYKYHGARRTLFVLPVLMVIWVNVHGGYLIGIALVALFTGAEWLNYLFGAGRTPVQKQRLLELSLIAAATTLASLVNPEFVGHWLYPFQVLGMEANHYIQEWQSPDFHQILPKMYLLLCGLFLLSYVYATPKADITELLVPGFFLFNGFVSVRHVPLAVLAMLPFIALALARGSTAACAARWQGSWLGRRYARAVGGGKQLGGQAEGLLNWLLLLVIVMVLSLYRPVFRTTAEKQAERLPAGAADYVIANRIQGNMFNVYKDGGYLIYRLGPQRKVFIDGRADVYGDTFIKDYMQMYSGQADWKRKFERHAIDYAIVDKNAPIRQLLLTDGSFREVFRDKRYSVLLRTVPRQPVLSSRSSH